LTFGAALLLAKAATTTRAAADAGASRDGEEPEAKAPLPAPVPRRAHASAPLQDRYYTISANPAFPQYQTSREFRFDRSGCFTKGGSSGGTVAIADTSPGAVMAGESSTHTGTYEVEQGHLLLRYDNGHVERFRLRRESDVIWLDNTPFVQASG
ncbi:MAG TPA: hypothetical protein VK524_10230, partial [Polyangiaceae bacterium]|nr:hypothetical protein [Polyangiaceae bacterium]